MSVKLLFSERTILYYAALPLIYFITVKHDSHNDFFVSPFRLDPR